MEIFKVGFLAEYKKLSLRCLSFSYLNTLVTWANIVNSKRLKNYTVMSLIISDYLA